MLRSTAFSTLSSKIILFTSDVAFNQGRALTALLADLQHTFDGQVVTLPLPADAPGEIPRITLNSSDGALSLEAGPQRLSILFRAKNDVIENTDSQIELVLRVFDAYAKALNFRISRLAINLSRFSPIDDPAMVIARHFCKDELLERRGDFKAALSRTETMELHAHKRFELLENLLVNSWVRVKTVRQQQEQPSGVLVEQDINTLAERENTANFSKQIISDIIRKSLSESTNILELYFGNGQETGGEN